MSSYVRKKTPGNTEWFVADRFGMFIHFGLYSMAARHEWMKKKERTPEEKYDKYFKLFNPDLIDVHEWVKSAKKAGMKYIVLTTKHHEGFCLFDSKYTDYKITNTPYGKDLVREYVEACREEGIKVGFYYSLLDWHHPDYPIDSRHPRWLDENAAELDKNRDIRRYAEYMRNQVEELLTNYGKIDILWFDFSYKTIDLLPWMQHNGVKGKEQWESEKLIALCRKLQPEIIIDNRTEIEQDIQTPEQFQPTEWLRDEKTGELLTWETCQTLSGSWGYYRDEYSWKSPEMLINMLVNTVSVGGNLIMNVGPTSRGVLDYRAENALEVYGEWMRYNGRSIYNCTMAEPEFTAPDGTKLTQSTDEKRLYIHLQTYPFKDLKFKGLSIERVYYAQFLSDGSEVLYKKDENDENTTVFELPVIAPHGLCPVIEVILKN